MGRQCTRGYDPGNVVFYAFSKGVACRKPEAGKLVTVQKRSEPKRVLIGSSAVE
jgi:hypothetical protein